MGFAGAAGQNHFGVANHNAVGCHGNRLQARGTKPVDRDCRNFRRQSGALAGDASDVHPSFALGHGAAEDDVFDVFGIKPRHAANRLLHGDGGKIIRPRGAQRAFKRFSNRRTDGTDDDGVSHRVTRDS
jgi:hypothetical protein